MVPAILGARDGVSASSRRSFRIPASTTPAGANLRSNRRRFATPPAVYRSFGRAAVAAFSTTSATTLGSFGSCDHFLHLLGERRTNLAILIELRVGLHDVRVERRLRVRRLDDRDPDAPRAELMVERFRIAFHRVLGCGIERLYGIGRKPSTEPMLMMRPLPCASHVRHDGARHPDQPEEVRIEDRPGLIERALFCSGGGDTEARVVHKQIDAAFRRITSLTRPPRIRRWSRRGAASRTIARLPGRPVCWCRRPCSRLAASRCAVASPMPDDAPVTSATLPFEALAYWHCQTSFDYDRNY